MTNTSAISNAGAHDRRATGAFPDPHRARKLAETRSLLELDGWITAARERGDTEAVNAAMTRKYEIERGRK